MQSPTDIRTLKNEAHVIFHFLSSIFLLRQFGLRNLTLLSPETMNRDNYAVTWLPEEVRA